MIYVQYSCILFRPPYFITCKNTIKMSSFSDNFYKNITLK